VSPAPTTPSGAQRTSDVEGATLHYVVEGSGEPVLAFAHGWCSKLEHWDAQAAAFRGSHRVVRWDRRGMGRSTTAAPAEGPQRHADDLVAILDREGIDRVVVTGHAGGGPTAVAFAALHPDRALGLVMVDTRLHRPPPPGDDDRFASGILRSADKLPQAGAPYFERMYRGFFGVRATPAVVDDAVANALATSYDVAASEIRHMATDTAALAARVTCPVLWVSAFPDDTEGVVAQFAAVDGGPMVGHVVGSGHFVQVEVPEQLNPMIDAFLDQRVVGREAVSA
jgi:pimeloyl-ACP methyl ester carboxylesterase